MNLGFNQNDGKFIEEKLKEKLEELSKDEAIINIGINNTGGTKPMSIYSTIALREYAKLKSIKAFECYLDSDINKIRVKTDLDNKTCPKDDDLRNLLSDIQLSDILYIHNLKNKKNMDINPITYDNLNEYKVEKDKLKKRASILMKEHWREYKEIFERSRNISKNKNILRELKEQFNSSDSDKQIPIDDVEKYIKDKIFNNDDSRKKNDLNFSKYKIQCESIAYYLKQKNITWFKDVFEICNEELYLSEKKAEGFYKYMNGFWLEHYVILALEESLLQLGIKDNIKIYHSVECMLLETNNKPCFEVDIVLLNGYELTVITCTLDGSEYLTKSKAFEGIYRVEQLGGSHAKLIVLNMLDDEKRATLEANIKSFNSQFYKNSKIITKNQLSDFEEAVNTFKSIFE